MRVNPGPWFRSTGRWGLAEGDMRRIMTGTARLPRTPRHRAVATSAPLGQKFESLSLKSRLKVVIEP